MLLYACSATSGSGSVTRTRHVDIQWKAPGIQRRGRRTLAWEDRLSVVYINMLGSMRYVCSKGIPPGTTFGSRYVEKMMERGVDFIT